MTSDSAPVCQVIWLMLMPCAPVMPSVDLPSAAARPAAIASITFALNSTKAWWSAP